MENHNDPASRLKAALITRYVVQLEDLELDDLAMLAAKAMEADATSAGGYDQPQFESLVPALSKQAPPAFRPAVRDRPVVGDVWKRKSNGTVVTIKRVDGDSFSTNKQIKWPTGTMSRQRFPLSEYAKFVKEFELIQAGEAV